jgi:drug/metabolite transporter (DMT)-like permease
MNLERKSSLLIICACLLWAFDLLVRYPVTLKMNFASIVFIESLVGLIFIAPFIFKNRKDLKKISKSDWFIALFVGGIGMSVAGYLQAACIQKATPGLFSFFQIFQPLFVIFLAHMILKDRIDNMYLYWGIWVVLSAILMFSVDLEIMINSEIILSDILIALSIMLIWGMCTILSKIFLKNNSALILVGLRWFFAFIFSSVILLAEGEKLPQEFLMQADIMVRFIFIAVVSGLFSMHLYYSGLKHMSAGKVSFIEISYSAFGMIFSALYTFEVLTFFQMLGAASFFAFIILFLSRQDSGIAPIRTRQLR